MARRNTSSPSIRNIECDPKLLSPWERNARLHSKKQVAQLVKSIETFGFTAPVLIDEANSILAGHGRVLAALRLGMSTIPCRCLSGLSANQKRALVIADNKLALNATWDEAILAAELEALIVVENAIDIQVIGFEPMEIDTLIEADIPGQSDKSSDDDTLPPKSEVPPITQNGDLWICGNHRIICGDSLSGETYSVLMGAEPAQMVFTDPPYNVPISGHVCGSGKIQHREFAMASGEMSSVEFTEMLSTVCELLVAHSIDGSIHYICMDWRHAVELTTACQRHYHEQKNLIVWVKDNGGMGSFYRSRHELIFVFKNGTSPHANNFGLGQHGRYRTNVWQYRGISSHGAGRLEELGMHPTVKPVAMIADAMRDCSARGGIVLDAFGGSGSTMIAAEKTRRRARLIEIDPAYVDRTIRRWQTFAKDDAIHAASGQTFNERAQILSRNLKVQPDEAAI